MKRAMLLLALLVVGCQTTLPEPPKTYPVKGKVMQNGSPLAGGRVKFCPTDTSKNEGIAEINKDGSFVLSSYRKEDGATPGEYVVIIDPVSYKNGTAQVAVRVNQRYQNKSTSDLKAEVKAEDNNFTFNLK